MKLASIEIIENIIHHPNADQLEIAKILNWNCVIRKNKHKAGERIVYVPIDTLVPNRPWSEFLHKNNNRSHVHLKISKLRGEVSYGLVLPLSVLPKEYHTLEIGTDVGEILNIKKHEKNVPAHLLGEIAGDFPIHLISHTDEINGLSDPELVKAVLQYPVTITQKLDGSSGTVIIKNGVITDVCSRRLNLKKNPNSVFWIAANKIDIPAGWTGYVQAETVGPGIQKNKLRLFDPEFRVFNIKREDGTYMNYRELEVACNELKLQPVPVVEYKTENITLNSLQEIANKQTLPNGNPAEGIVVRPWDYRVGSDGKPLGFKILNVFYKE